MDREEYEFVDMPDEDEEQDGEGVVGNTEEERQALVRLQHLVEKHGILEDCGTSTAHFLTQLLNWLDAIALEVQNESAQCLDTKEKLLDTQWKIRLGQCTARLVLVLQKGQLKIEESRPHADKRRVMQIGNAIKKMEREVLESLSVSKKRVTIARAMHDMDTNVLDRTQQILENSLSAKRNPYMPSCLRTLLSIAFNGTNIALDEFVTDGKGLLHNTVSIVNEENCEFLGCALLFLVLEALVVIDPTTCRDWEEAANTFASNGAITEKAARATLCLWMIERSETSEEVSRYIDQAVRRLARLNLNEIFPFSGEDDNATLDVFYVIKRLHGSDPPRFELANDFMFCLSTPLEPDSTDKAKTIITQLIDSFDWKRSNQDAIMSDLENDEEKMEQNQLQKQWHYLMMFQRKILLERDLVVKNIFENAWRHCNGDKKLLSELFLRTPLTLDEQKWMEEFLTDKKKSQNVNEVQAAYDLLVAYHIVHNQMASAQEVHKLELGNHPTPSDRLEIRNLLVQKQIATCVPPHLTIDRHYGSILQLGNLLQGLANTPSPLKPSSNVQGIKTAQVKQPESPRVSGNVNHSPVQNSSRPVVPSPFAPSPPATESFFASSQNKNKTLDNKKPLASMPEIVRRSSTPKHTQLYTRRRKAPPMPTAATKIKPIIMTSQGQSNESTLTTQVALQASSSDRTDPTSILVEPSPGKPLMNLSINR